MAFDNYFSLKDSTVKSPITTIITGLLVLIFAFGLSGQESYPGCTASFDLTATGTTNPIDLRYKNCGTVVDVTYLTTPSISALSLTLEGAPDSGAGPGTFTTVSASYLIGANPSTTLVSGRIRALFAVGVPAYIRVNATITGTGNLRGVVAAMSTAFTYTSAGGSSSVAVTDGQTATGATLTGRALTVSGVETGTGFVRPLLTDATGQLLISASGGLSSNIANGQTATGASLSGRAVTVSGVDGSGFVRPLFTDATGILFAKGPTVTGTTVLTAAQFPLLTGGIDSGNALRSHAVDVGGRTVVAGSAAVGASLGANPVVAAGVTTGGNLVRSLFVEDSGYLYVLPTNTTGGGAGTTAFQPTCNQSAYVDLTSTTPVVLTIGAFLQRAGVCSIVASQGATAGTIRFITYDSGACNSGSAANIYTHQMYIPANSTVAFSTGPNMRLFQSNVSHGVCVESSTAQAGVTISYYLRQ